jgi:hypothetical protein
VPAGRVGDRRRAPREIFLEIGPARGQLTANGEIPAPSATGQGHADRELPIEGLSEEPAAQVQEPLLQAFVHAMTEDVEESVLAASLSDLIGHGTPARGPSDQRSDIDDR